MNQDITAAQWVFIESALNDMPNARRGHNVALYHDWFALATGAKKKLSVYRPTIDCIIAIGETLSMGVFPSKDDLYFVYRKDIINRQYKKFWAKVVKILLSESRDLIALGSGYIAKNKSSLPKECFEKIFCLIKGLVYLERGFPFWSGGSGAGGIRLFDKIQKKCGDRNFFDGPINKKSGILVIHLPVVEPAFVFAPHGDIEKRAIYPQFNWTHVLDRAELVHTYPRLPDRIIDNLIKEDVKISVTSWHNLFARSYNYHLADQDAHNFKLLIDLAFRHRKSCKYDFSRPLRRSNS